MAGHISFDLETLGIEHDAHILSIGAVKFDKFGVLAEDAFYRSIQLEGPGQGSVSISTVKWWIMQSQEARAAAFGDGEHRYPLVQALIDFSSWAGFDHLVQWWQRGDRDALWLQSAYRRCQMTEPFMYWQMNDQRTLCKFSKAPMPARCGTHHNALDDAIYQAQCIIAALNHKA